MARVRYSKIIPGLNVRNMHQNQKSQSEIRYQKSEIYNLEIRNRKSEIKNQKINHTWSLCEEHASDLPYFGHDLLLKQTMDPQ